MAETGASPIEVSIMNESSFDFERNTVYIEGHKGHADRIVPIKTELSALMKLYFVKYDTLPRNGSISRKFRKYRDLLSTKLESKISEKYTFIRFTALFWNNDLLQNKRYSVHKRSNGS